MPRNADASDRITLSLKYANIIYMHSQAFIFISDIFKPRQIGCKPYTFCKQWRNWDPLPKIVLSLKLSMGTLIEILVLFSLEFSSLGARFSKYIKPSFVLFFFILKNRLRKQSNFKRKFSDTVYTAMNNKYCSTY